MWYGYNLLSCDAINYVVQLGKRFSHERLGFLIIVIESLAKLAVRALRQTDMLYLQFPVPEMALVSMHLVSHL